MARINIPPVHYHFCHFIFIKTGFLLFFLQITETVKLNDTSKMFVPLLMQKDKKVLFFMLR